MSYTPNSTNVKNFYPATLTTPEIAYGSVAVDSNGNYEITPTSAPNSFCLFKVYFKFKSFINPPPSGHWANQAGPATWAVSDTVRVTGDNCNHQPGYFVAPFDFR